MSNATRFKKAARHGGEVLLHFVHGALVLAGLVAVAHAVVSYVNRYEPVHFVSTGLLDAHAASVERIVSDINRPLTFAPPPPAVPLHGAARYSGEVALSGEMQRVRDWVARRYRVSSAALEPVLAKAEDTAREAGLDPLLIVAMMAIESSFNPFAESQMGAQGLMQVIPRWHMDKIGEDAAEDALFDPLFNVEIGTLVLVEGLKRYGSLQAALQYYGGARSDPEARYSKRVLAMKQRIAAVARATDA